MEKLFKTRNFKILRASLLTGLIISLLLQTTLLSKRCETVRDGVLRLHVLANSDSESDQSLKLKVRDRLINETAVLFAGAKTQAEAQEISTNNLELLKEFADDEIKKNGYDYTANVRLEKAYFETRCYGNVTLPAGEYEAIRVLIGQGAGKNWWCVMFPPLCLPAAQESNSLDTALDDGTRELVENGEKYEIKFKAVEIYQDICVWLRDIF